MNVKDLNPALVWEIFDAITRVPRPSKKEAKIRAFCWILPVSMGLRLLPMP